MTNNEEVITVCYATLVLFFFPFLLSPFPFPSPFSPSIDSLSFPWRRACVQVYFPFPFSFSFPYITKLMLYGKLAYLASLFPSSQFLSVR
ncbi:hypothetical protein F4810DRAFT_668751 [Camillea tinctor]|nr:hypothetical protein F4810DRAFT_668751 [Camillea tinctor]